MSLHQIARVTFILGVLFSTSSVGWMLLAQPHTAFEWVMATGIFISGTILIFLGIQLTGKAKKESRIGSLHFDFREGKTI